jgi:hypothetical protein
MSRFITSLSFGMGLASCAMAQDLFLEPFGTWQMPIGGISGSSYSRVSTQSTYRSTDQTVKLNFGNGPGAGLVFGGQLHGPLGWEARFTYMVDDGDEIEYNSSDAFSGYSTASKTVFTTRFLRIEPALRLSAGDSTTQWYAAMGPSLVVFGNMTTTDDYSRTQTGSFPYSTTEKTVSEYTGRIGLGGFGAVGLLRQGPGRLGFFAEVSIHALSWAPMRSEITAYTVDGQDRLSQLTTAERETEYVDSYTETDAQALSQPSKSTKLYLPMTTFGARIGLHVLLGK